MTKITKTATLCMATLSLIGLANATHATPPPEAAACVACHGPGGQSTIPQNPVLAGQHEAYLKKQLLDFKSGKRKDPIMSAMAKPLTKKQIDTLAKYFSAQ